MWRERVIFRLSFTLIVCYDIITRVWTMDYRLRILNLFRKENSKAREGYRAGKDHTGNKR